MFRKLIAYKLFSAGYFSRPTIFIISMMCLFFTFHAGKSYAGGDPYITLQGDSGLLDTMKLEQGYSYKEPGYKATSALYGDITKNVIITSKIVGGTSSFNDLIVATFVISYNVTDAAGNKAVTQYRVVRVFPDTLPPNLKVAQSKNGTDTIIQEVFYPNTNLKPAISSYVISSIDLVDGNLTSSVYIDSSLVQTDVVGVYPIVYNSTDLSGNRAIVYRYVKVIDTLKPLISLNGTVIDSVEIYSKYTDPGVQLSTPNKYFTSTQLNRWLTISGTINDTSLGTYKITYDLTDTFGNKAIPVVRTVKVVDHIPPVIKLLGSAQDTVEVYSGFNDPGFQIVAANRLFSVAQLTKRLIVTGKVNDTIFGKYSITYNLTDSLGNKAISAVRTVWVIDTARPVLTLIGSANNNVAVYTTYKDQGVKVTAANRYFSVSSLTKRLTVSNPVNTSLVKIYKITYNLTDSFGNQARAVVRTVSVIDTVPPVITLNGALKDSISLYSNFVEPGYVVSDNYNQASDIKVSLSGSFYQNFPTGKSVGKVGTYTIVYTAIDASGNKDSAIRTVKVYNVVFPVLTLKGNDPVSACQNSVYKDEGYTVTNYDASRFTVDTVSDLIRTGGHYLTGNYFVRYIVKYIQGYHVDSASRIINVLDSTTYPCNQSAVNETLNQFKDVKIYPNPANQMMNIDAGDQKILNIRIVDVVGRNVYDQNGPNEGIIQIPVSQLNTGIYTVIIDSQNGTITRQVFKD